MKVTLNRFFIISTSILVILLCCSSESEAQTKKTGVHTVVLDPGHGGKDAGCVRNGLYEKDIALKVALYLGEYIAENLPDVKVVYTRKTDEFIELNERGNIANKAGADLFISIHVNANRSSSPSGSETYVMGTDKANANLDVAMLENDVVSFEDDYSAKYEGYIPGSTESFIIFSLMQYAYLDQSMNFANVMQKHYTRNTPIVNRGVKQAGFLVLWKTAMPSVLTEIGFLSNDNDRRYLTTEAGQRKIARSMFNAFSEYKSKVDGKSKAIYLDDTHVSAASSDSSQNGSQNGYVRPSSAPSMSVKSEDVAVNVAVEKPNVYFSVQLCSSTARVSPQSSTFKEYRGQVTERKVGNLYKYYVGECKTYNEAISLQAKVRKSIKDAFIVGIKNDVPIPQAEARRLIE